MHWILNMFRKGLCPIEKITKVTCGVNLCSTCDINLCSTSSIQSLLELASFFVCRFHRASNNDTLVIYLVAVFTFL
uniref:Uncharacterized protein n=1 Tax=Octopus bimaculoides TaxID=37653 RepID=A0A0L8HGE1_OCTBM